MHEKYFAELERRFAGRNMSACLQASRIIGFKAGRSRSSLEYGCFRWSLHPSSGLLSNRLVVVDAETVWDDFVVKERFRDLLQPFSGVDGCVVYLCNWKRAANRHTAQLNRLFRQAVMQDTTGTGIGTPSKQQRITKTAADLENEFFLEAVDLGVKVNFSTAATEAQGLVELMDFVLEMTRVVAKNAWDCVTNRLATTAAAQNCRLTLPPDTKVKCGKDALDCWHRMLCQIPRITPPVADALVKHFPTFKSLMRAVNACSCDEDGQRLFQDLRLHEGEGKRLGPSLALRLYRYFKQ